MARSCTICEHPSRAAIDKRLASGVAIPPLAAEHRVSPDALRRHQRAHLPVQLVRREVLREAKDTLDVSRLLAVASGSAVEVLTQARQQGRPELTLRAIDRVLACLAVQLKINELVDTAALNERLLLLEERLAGPGLRPPATRFAGGPPWAHTAT